MILIADAHVSSANENVTSFFDMLDLLGQIPGDIVFLGDIFDLWVALPRYQEADQERFLRWCEEQKKHRCIGFVEGNHEFYLDREAYHFSWFTRHEKKLCNGKVIVCHGDLVNRDDKQYLRWRNLSKSAAMRAFVRFLPFGPRIVQHVKKGMKKTNRSFRMGLPENWLAEYLEDKAASGYRWVLMGHFHQHRQLKNEAGSFLQVLPDWFSSGQVGSFDEQKMQLKIVNWKALKKDQKA